MGFMTGTGYLSSVKAGYMLWRDDRTQWATESIDRKGEFDD